MKYQSDEHEHAADGTCILDADETPVWETLDAITMNLLLMRDADIPMSVFRWLEKMDSTFKHYVSAEVRTLEDMRDLMWEMWAVALYTGYRLARGGNELLELREPKDG